MPPSPVSDSVGRTALDALAAKGSAIAAGYQPFPQNANVYQEFLHQIMPTTKRQSPLVSAGYAMRMASVAHAVHAFVAFHSDQKMNIVLLGCGMEVLGLWASSLAPERVQVWEVDTRAVATAKRDKLVENKLVVPNSLEGKCDGIILEGRISQQEGATSSSTNNYHLIASDLRDLESLNSTLGHAFAASIFHDCPTLVVFELVLAYLEPEATNQLLEWCASKLLLSSCGSALMAFEALGPTKTSNCDNNNTPSIVKAYQQAYTRQFEAKLQRGKAAKGETNNAEIVGVFQPLGSSCELVEQRIQSLAGFAKAHACLAGTAARWAEKKQECVELSLPPGELLDEHAALILHLSSYTQVVAFPSNNQISFRLGQKLCPWYYSWTRSVSSNGTFVTIIEPEDEAAVRDLFASTYEELIPAYSAVKKMVQAALKKELASSSTASSKSAVRLGYQRLGGDFFVAVQYDQDNEEEPRRVLGGIGVRKWNSNKTNDPTTICYEIHRFFVHPQHRREGIGAAMLQMAESWVHSQVVRRSRKPYRIAATTLAILEEANQFYTKHGYCLHEEVSIGVLQMKTYAKDVR